MLIRYLQKLVEFENTILLTSEEQKAKKSASFLEGNRKKNPRKSFLFYFKSMQKCSQLANYVYDYVQ